MRLQSSAFFGRKDCKLYAKTIRCNAGGYAKGKNSSERIEKIRRKAIEQAGRNYARRIAYT